MADEENSSVVEASQTHAGPTYNRQRYDDFVLNISKNLEKKSIACARQDIHIEKKRANGGYIITLHSAVYELYKYAIRTYFSENSCPVDTEINIRLDLDATKNNHRDVITIRKNGKAYCTVNLFHTTSRIQVNGKSCTAFVSNDLTKCEKLIQDYLNSNQITLEDCKVSIQRALRTSLKDATNKEGMMKERPTRSTRAKTMPQLKASEDVNEEQNQLTSSEPSDEDIQEIESKDNSETSGNTDLELEHKRNSTDSIETTEQILEEEVDDFIDAFGNIEDTLDDISDLPMNDPLLDYIDNSTEENTENDQTIQDKESGNDTAGNISEDKNDGDKVKTGDKGNAKETEQVIHESEEQPQKENLMETDDENATMQSNNSKKEHHLEHGDLEERNPEKKKNSSKSKAQFCLIRGCKHGRQETKRISMIQCSMCFNYFHYDCTDDDKSLLDACVVFTCSGCRNIAFKVEKLQSDSEEILSKLQDLPGFSTQANSLKAKCQSINSELQKMQAALTKFETAVKSQTDVMKQLNSTLVKLSEKLENDDKPLQNTINNRQSTSTTNQMSYAQATAHQKDNVKQTKGTLVVGDFIIQGITLAKDDTMICTPRGDIKASHEELRKVKLSGKKYDQVVLVTGANDCYWEENLKLVIEEYQSMILVAKQMSVKVLISSVCPRGDDPEIGSRIEAFNAELQIVCDELNVTWVNNDLKLCNQDGMINKDLYENGKVLLNQEGLKQLVANLGLKGAQVMQTSVQNSRNAAEKENLPRRSGRIAQGTGRDRQSPRNTNQTSQYYGTRRSSFDVDFENKRTRTNSSGGKDQGTSRKQNYSNHETNSRILRTKGKVNADEYQRTQPRNSSLRSNEYRTQWRMNYSSHEKNERNQAPPNQSSHERKQGYKRYYYPRNASTSSRENRYTETYRNANRSESGQLGVRKYQSPRCYFCAEIGHVKDSCRHRRPVQCNSCFDYGHKSKFCHLNQY